MALFHNNQLKTIVLIEREENSSNSISYTPHATGFLVGFLSENKPEGNIYNLFLVTNRHVFDGIEKLWFRFDTDSTTIRFPVSLKNDAGNTLWLQHKNPKVDIAMITISPSVLDGNKVKWKFFVEENIKYSKDFESTGINIGDEIYVIGFPMGISGTIQNYAIVRSGSISRLDDEILKEHNSFLVDAFVFPGNSGGPVVLKPQSLALDGTKAVNETPLIGVVSGYRIHQEPLYSHQTNPPMIAGYANQNSGLSFVVPMDFAKEIYNDWLESKKPINPVEIKS